MQFHVYEIGKILSLKSNEEFGEIDNILHCFCDCKIVSASTLESIIYQHLVKLKMHLSIVQQ